MLFVHLLFNEHNRQKNIFDEIQDKRACFFFPSFVLKYRKYQTRRNIMIYLLLAILSSALISVIMRLSTDKVQGNLSMLAVNYLTCFIIAGAFTGVGSLFVSGDALPKVLPMGVIHGVLYLVSFVLFQMNVNKNGVVLSSVFMKLGLLVPLAVSILVFGETPTALQIIGFIIAIGAIILINAESHGTNNVSGLGLVILLLAGGVADAMSKVYEEIGPSEFSSQFLLYTFLTAFALCSVLVVVKRQPIHKNELLFGVLIGIPNFFSAKFLLASLDSLPAVIAYPTFSVATILAVTMVGVAVFKEKLTTRQIVAVCAILVALVSLNIQTVN